MIRYSSDRLRLQLAQMLDIIKQGDLNRAPAGMFLFAIKIKIKTKTERHEVLTCICICRKCVPYASLHVTARSNQAGRI